MASGREFVALAKKHVGEPYVLGARVPKQDSAWRGPWDCAEFVSWVAYRVTGHLVGCQNGDAYTGYWRRDALAGVVRSVPVEQASAKMGAILLRYPTDVSPGHIVFVAGNNQTVEAHSAKAGVIESVISGRRWDIGVLIPGVVYDDIQATYRIRSPRMRGRVIEEIQSALRRLGFDPGPTDGVFGARTERAVYDFQVKHGLLADGEVGPVTAKLLGA